MSLLTVNNVKKEFNGEPIFENITFRLEWGQKLGLVGRNGSGKTTLLRILTGQSEAQGGSVNFWTGIRAGYLKQEDGVHPDKTVLQEAEAAFAHVMEEESRLREIEVEMGSATGEALDSIMQEYGRMRDRFEAMGGYDNLRDIPGVLKRLGFTGNDIHKLCGKLSGGEKTRLAMARLLLSGPDILFLDEPTNHLDIEATEWLESFLRDFGGAIVLVSHDRYFLDRVVTSVADMDQGKLTVYNGNFSGFHKQKQENRRRQEELFNREQSEIARLTAFFEKWKNTPSKKNQAVMRMRWAERIKAHGLTQSPNAVATERPDMKGKNVKFAIKPTQVSGNEVVIFDNLGKQYGSRVLFSGFSGMIRRNERVGVVGPNGAGKSTLIKLLLDREPPTSGMARLGASVTVGYFAQDTSDLDLDATVLDNIMDVREVDPVDARTHLGKFLFTGDDAFKQVRMLSGGEKNKLVLAQLTLLRPNLLILDEPTNHLDLESREALGNMLNQFDGTLILISHDRYLLDQVTDRTLEVADGHAALYDLPYTQYREAKSLGKLPGQGQNKPASNGNAPASQSVGGKNNLSDLLAQRPDMPSVPAGMNAYQLSKERQRAKAATIAAEQKIADLEARVKTIEAKLSAPAATDNVVALSQEHGGVHSALDEAMSAWERAAAYQEALG